MKRLTFFLWFCLAGWLQQAKAGDTDHGKTIFNARCGACHAVNKVVVGPSLGGVDQRHPIEWIIGIVHSSQGMIRKGDKDATALFEKFNKVTMPDHPDLSEEDIKHVVAYIKLESAKSEGEAKAPFAKPGRKRAAYTPPSSQDGTFFIIYIGAVLVLVRALVYAVQIRSYARKMKAGIVNIVSDELNPTRSRQNLPS